MDYEDRIVFPYIEELLKGNVAKNFKISDFASKHESVVSKLNELKDIFLQHYAMPNTRMLNLFRQWKRLKKMSTRQI